MILNPELYGLLSALVFLGVVATIALGLTDRAVAGALGVLVLIALNALKLNEVPTFVDWDVLGLVVLMSFYSAVLEESGFAKWVALKLSKNSIDIRLVLYLAILSCGILSLILENAVTIFVFAPVALQLAKAVSVSPAPLLIGMALAAGMAGSATMIGDPPAVIAAGRYHLSFLDFFIYENKPSIFFITVIPMALATAAFTLFNFRNLSSSRAVFLKEDNVDKAFVIEAFFFLLVKVVLLSLRKQLDIPMSLAALIALLGVIMTRALIHKDIESTKRILAKGLDARLPVFLLSVFLLSGALKKHGVTDAIAEAVVSWTNGNMMLTGTLLFFISAALSALIENIPVTLTMFPIVDSIAEKLGLNPMVFVWSVLIGLTAGGGWTYIGSGANVVAVHILEREGFRVSFFSFIKTALPFNIINTTTCFALYAIIWLPR
ncbi:MAG: SLC13 family permease [Acidilobaceae archaeon]